MGRPAGIAPSGGLNERGTGYGPNVNTSHEGPRPARPASRRLAIALVALAVVAVAFVAGILGRGLVGEMMGLPLRTEVIDRSQPAVLLAIRDIAELRAASGEYSVILDVEDDVPFIPSSLIGERTLFVAQGTVDAAVDLSGLGEGAVEVSEDGTSVTLTLPPAQLAEPHIDPDGSYVYDRDQGLLNRIGGALTGDASDDQPLYQEAVAMLAEAAASSDLQDRAEDNTEQVLLALLESLGFDDVSVEYASG